MNGWMKTPSSRSVQAFALGFLLCFKGATLVPPAMAAELPAIDLSAALARIAAFAPARQVTPPRRPFIRRRYRPRASRYFPSWGAPAWSRGGAARGGCDQAETPLIPLMPVLADNGKEPSFFGVTVSERPTFFAYVPKTRARKIEFLLIDEQHSRAVVDEQAQTISGEPQIISFTVNRAVGLTAERNYKWYFTTVCNPDDPVRDDNSGNPSISGLVERHSPDLPTKKLTGADADQGAWLDVLSELAKARCKAPTDPTIASDWQNLLQAMELKKIPKLAEKVKLQAIAVAPLSCAQLQ